VELGQLLLDQVDQVVVMVEQVIHLQVIQQPIQEDQEQLVQFQEVLQLIVLVAQVMGDQEQPQVYPLTKVTVVRERVVNLTDQVVMVARELL
jgi:hypothetical protein